MRPASALATGLGLAILTMAGAPCTTDRPEGHAGGDVSAHSLPAPAADAVAAVEPEPSIARPRSTPADSAAPAERVPWPPTQLPFTLVATLDDPAGTADRATIRDGDSGIIANYHKGDMIRDGVEVLDVDSGVVELSNQGEVEYLSVSTQPFHVDPEDVFYPDLVDDLGTAMGEGIQMPPGPGYVLKAPDNAWGTPKTVAVLRDAIRSYTRDHDGPKVRIGDLSLSGGGPFPPHLSHREGRDVDIGYVLTGASADSLYFVEANAHNLDRARTWALLQALLATGEVAYVFMDYELQKLMYLHAESIGIPQARRAELFQYPNGRRASRGIIRHWKGHRGHFHVRLRRQA